jgi:hypothetical protein
MAASTIPKSGGPGSPIELSPITIAVRDKVIEKFAGQPLDDMNSSLKALLSKEEDEQKRLGILAARVYILRQRIISIGGGDPERVVTSFSPTSKDLAGEDADDANHDVSETATNEWTRLRILEDCEVNGVRFPKTLIIDVKSADAERLVENGKAEIIEESEQSPAVSEKRVEAETAPQTTIDAPSENAALADTETQSEEAAPTDYQPEEGTTEAPDSADLSTTKAEDPSTMLEALSDEPSAESDPVFNDAADELANDAKEDVSRGKAVIEAPSAAEVTAALEALGASNPDSTNGTNRDDASDDATDVAAELAALSATSASTDGMDATSGDAAEVAAALEAASAAMATGPSNTDISDLPAAGEEQDGEEGHSDKPEGWFEAQREAEVSKRKAEKSDDGEE